MSQYFKKIDSLMAIFLDNMEDIICQKRDQETKQKLGADFNQRIAAKTDKMEEAGLRAEAAGQKPNENEECQKLILEHMDLVAIAATAALQEAEIKAAVPNALKTQDTVEFFEAQGAKNMASLIKKAM